MSINCWNRQWFWKWCARSIDIAVAAAEKWNSSVLAAVALHPNEAPVVEDLEADLKIIEELAQHPRVRAIGETGLDYFRTPPELRKRQQDSFKWHIELAKKTNKALVIQDPDHALPPLRAQYLQSVQEYFLLLDEETGLRMVNLFQRATAQLAQA